MLNDALITVLIILAILVIYLIVQNRVKKKPIIPVDVETQKANRDAALDEVVRFFLILLIIGFLVGTFIYVNRMVGSFI